MAAKVWTNYDAARWCGVRDSAHEKLYPFLMDPVPEVFFSFFICGTDVKWRYGWNSRLNWAVVVCDWVSCATKYSFPARNWTQHHQISKAVSQRLLFEFIFFSFCIFLQVRAAVVFALGTFMNNSTDRNDHANSIDQGVATKLLTVLNDGSPLVRKVNYLY